MDNEKTTKILARIENLIIKEKGASLKSQVITEAIKDEEYVNLFNMASLYIKESIDNSPEYAAERFKKAMLYMSSHDLREIAALVGTYSKKGVEFLKCLNKNLTLNKEQARRMHDFIRTTERTNELIEKGYNDLEASHFANCLTDLFIVDNSEEIALTRIEKYASDGVTMDGEEVVYQEMRNELTGENYFVIFFVKGNSYLRYIGKSSSSLVHVVNETGRFEEMQEKEFKVIPVKLESEMELYSKNPYQLPESDPNSKKREVNHETLMEVYKEINELAEFNGKSFVAEDIYNKKVKLYELK